GEFDGRPTEALERNLSNGGAALIDHVNRCAADGQHAFISSFFSGEVAKIDLASGNKVGSIATQAPKAVAGLAEFRG
ncbi:MAG: hypothetical protein EB048_09110, partial [Gammaproteobacteria bacterium]|nr:hypothetical protein [Gammaproteobacteria bacterium]